MHAEGSGFGRGGAGEAIAKAAATWLARRDRGLTPAEQEAFLQWRAADPRHATELAQLESAWRECDIAQTSRELATELAQLESAWRECDTAPASPKLAAMAADLDRATALSANDRARFAPWLLSFAAAAAVSLAAGLVWWRSASESSMSRESAQSYRVLTSVARRIVFDDGSVAEARGDSEVRAEFTTNERRVLLVHGEAHFTVTKDFARPFVVRAGGAGVRAVGTAFNVRLGRERVEVLVTEGKVEVAEGRDALRTAAPPASVVVAGERAVVERNAADGASVAIEITSAALAEIEQALAWQSTRLVFDRTPLEEAVEAFNLYSATTTDIRVVIGDAALRTRRLGGTFRAANVEGFVRLLEQSVEVRAEQRGDRIVLLPVR